jgi:hypothetical protein
MALANDVTSGRIKSPDRIVLYGNDGAGKTFFASKMPAPIFIGPESGTLNFDVNRFKSIKTFKDIEKSLMSLINEKHDYKTVALDSADWIEPLLWDQVCLEEGVVNIEQVGGGYAKGYIIALKTWRKMLNLLERLQDEKGMNVIIIAHSQIKTFNDPSTGSAYDRYQLKLHDKASALLREWSHVVLFATYQVFTKGKEGAKHRAFGDGTRKMYSERRPAFDAKSRYSIPFELDLDYDAFRSAVDATDSEKIQIILENIKELLTLTADTELAGKVDTAVKKAGNNLQGLTLIQERLRSRLGKEE